MAYQTIGTNGQSGRSSTAPVQNRQMFMTMIGGGIILLLVGFGLIATAALFASKQAQLRDEGQTIRADVVDSQVVRTSKRGTITSTRYEVKYRFQVPGQAAITSDWEEGPEDVIRVANVTKTIQVRYLPSDPSVNSPAAAIDGATATATIALWRGGVGGVLVILGVVLLVFARKSAGAPRPAVGYAPAAHPVGR